MGPAQSTSYLARRTESLVVAQNSPDFEQPASQTVFAKRALHSWNGVQSAERSPRNLADFNGTVHRDVKLFVLHGKVTQFQRAHDDCVGGCLIRGRQGPNRFEEVDVQR